MNIIRGDTIPNVPASHEDPTDPGVLKKILLKHDDIPNGQIQMINWSTLLSGKTFQNHYHEAMDEIFILLDGSVTITIDGETEKLVAGDAVVVPLTCHHTMTNMGKNPVHYIAIGIVTGEGGRTVIVEKKL